jgi:hypothetical protein
VTGAECEWSVPFSAPRVVQLIGCDRQWMSSLRLMLTVVHCVARHLLVCLWLITLLIVNYSPWKYAY